MSDLQKLETQLAETQARHATELNEIQDHITTIKDKQLDELLARGAELGFNLRVVGNSRPAKKSSKTPETRAAASCSKCKSLGLSGADHTARMHNNPDRHSAWLATQDADTQAKF